MLTVSPLADPTPPRPQAALPEPAGIRTFRVDVDVAHLANPMVAVQRMLAADMGGFARVTGDEDRFTIEVVVPDGAGADVEAWVRWIVHHAGIRGSIHPV